METLAAYFAHHGFAGDSLRQLTDAFSPKKLAKGDLFAEEGRTSRYLGFVETGLLQYVSLVDGDEKTTYTSGSGSFVASLVSFLQAVPARETIRAVVDSSVWVIDRDSLRRLQAEVPAFQSFYVGLLEWQICCIDESRLDAIMLTARQRYEKMMAKEPALLQQIPLGYLASILGVTPRHLSRIRHTIR